MNSKLILIAVVVILALIVVGGYLYITTNQQSQQGGVQTTPTTKTPAKPIDTTTDILKDLEKIPDDSSVDKTMDSFGKTLDEF